MFVVYYSWDSQTISGQLVKEYQRAYAAKNAAKHLIDQGYQTVSVKWEKR